MQRALLFCTGAILVALFGYLFAFYGFNAVVRCEVEQHSFQQNGRTAIIELVSVSGCGL